MSEAKAKELWTSLQACLPKHYRTLEWNKLPSAVKQEMGRAVYGLIQDRDQEVIREARKQFLLAYAAWLGDEQSPAQLGFRLRTMRIEPPEVK